MVHFYQANTIDKQQTMQLKGFFLSIFSSFLLTTGIAQNQDRVYTVVDQMPYFPGCEAYAIESEEKRNCSNEAVVTYISNILIYPERAKEEGMEGVVYMSFVVDKTGKVIRPQILRDIGGGCGEEALRVVRSMPLWESGRLKGTPVKVQLKLPINFQFVDKEADMGYTFRWGGLTAYELSRKDLRRNLDEKVQIFDNQGELVSLASLTFSYNKNNRVASVQSNGSISSEMRRFVKKIKRGSLFSIIASIQKDGGFVEIDREFAIVK